MHKLSQGKIMIKVGIAGYGNLGKGVEAAVKAAADMELAAVFTRREPSQIKSSAPVYSFDDISKYAGKIDVMVLCGGSATDLPAQTPEIAKYFNFVDSFDNHADIPKHFETVDKIARSSKTAGVISAGWDPGLFSLQRLYGQAVLPQGSTETFWGEGVSQGHSDAIRRVEGVKHAVQYTVPLPEAVEAVRLGKRPELTARQKHKRICFVVAHDGADKEKILREIVTMPNYFAPYDTTVNFITEKEYFANHSAMPHGGFVFRAGTTGGGFGHVIEYSLKSESNPEFTASAMTAYARAVYRLSKDKNYGAKTVLDIPPAYLSSKSAAELYKELL